MANAIPEVCVFFPFYMLLLLTQFLCYSFLSSFLTDDTRSGKVSFDGFFLGSCSFYCGFPSNHHNGGRKNTTLSQQLGCGKL